MTLEENLNYIVCEVRGRVRRDNIRQIANSTCLPQTAIEQFRDTGVAPHRVLLEICRYFDNKAKQFARMTSP